MVIDFKLFDVATKDSVSIVQLKHCDALRYMIVNDLWEELERLIQSQKPPTLVLDLSCVTSIASEGIGALLKARKCVLDYGGELQLVGVNARVCKVFHMLNLDELFAIRVSGS